MLDTNNFFRSLGEFSRRNINAFSNFEQELTKVQLAELCIFNFCYSWLYLLENNLTALDDDDIINYHTACWLEISYIISNELDPIEFSDIFTERYKNHLKDLENFQTANEFPKYLFLRIFKYPLDLNEFNLDDTLEKYMLNYYVDEQFFTHCYVQHINKLLDYLAEITTK